MTDEPPSLVPADEDASDIGAISEHGSDEAPINPVTESQMVGWATTNEERSTAGKSSRNIRPMHVRLSVRIHHISFLHPGLDAGGSTLSTNRGKKKSFLPKKNDTPAGAPGPMAFGQRRGSWKNPSKNKVSKRNSSVDDSKHPNGYMEEKTASPNAMDAAELSEIISSETFRLSRDGVIQQHYALTTQHQQQQPAHGGVASPRAADMTEAARYYKECASRPKGYRRLVVSSMIPSQDNKIPNPPMKRQSSLGMLVSKSSKGFDHGRPEKVAKQVEAGDSFNDVEYRYVGPPNTGPAFFQLLRQHGAASFGRFLPEVACSVPKHSVAFELRKQKGMKHGGSASTQPIVIEAPHVIWGDARDKTLARIANEGCPLIDAREFEYVSNANLKDAELSETLMVCGATVWVKNATDEDLNRGTTPGMRSKNKETMVKAEYYGGMMADGVTNTAKGVAKGVVGVGKALTPKHKGKKDGASVVDSVTSNNPSTVHQEAKKKKKVKFGRLPKLRRKKKKTGTGDDGASINSAQSGLDDASIASLASESIGTQPGVINSTAITQEPIPRSTDNASFQESTTSDYAVVKSVPYVLILDDVINIQIVSFPEKDVLAKFPISVASVMSQRNINERIEDPLKPSELTATLIQEPSAPKMQWGVELKVTVRAVEVKPQVPRVIMPEMPASLGATMDAIQNELKSVRDQMVSLGKTQSEIDEAVRKKEKELSERERALDRAIVDAGLDIGEYGGANPDEIRKQQMFYDEREHKSIERKVRRRRQLSVSEQSLLKDARFDPAAMGSTNAYNNEHKIVKLLSTHFPGVDETSVTPKRSNSTSTVGDIRASLSLAMAESLDACLGEYLEAPTVDLVQQSLRQQSSLGHAHDGSQMTASEVKDWCYDVASKLSLSASHRGEQSKRSISQIQDVLVSSAGGHVAENLEGFETEEEDVSPDVVDEVNGWCMTVLSKLDTCAEELADHDDDESTQYSFNDEMVGTGQSKRSLTSSTASDTNEFQLSLPPLTVKNEADAKDSDSIDSDDEIWQQATSRRQSASNYSGSLQRVLRASALATYNETVSTGEAKSDRNMEPLLKSMRTSHFQVHRSENANNIGTSSPRQVKNDRRALKDYARIGSVVAVVFVLVMAVFAAKYFDVVLVFNKK